MNSRNRSVAVANSDENPIVSRSCACARDTTGNCELRAVQAACNLHGPSNRERGYRRARQQKVAYSPDMYHERPNGHIRRWV